MSDLINGREMLNRYQVDLCYGIACKECSMCTEDGGCRVEDWIDKFPSADRPQGWIPCSEKLPSENGDYLVTLENGVVKILGYSTTQRTTYPKGFYHIEDGFSWRQIQNPVVAWMPLPEAWKGVDDEASD